MAQNIHRVAKDCSPQLVDFAAKRIPQYADNSDNNVDADAAAVAGKNKGKRKATACSSSEDDGGGGVPLELAFLCDGMDHVKEDFVACVQVSKSLRKDANKAPSDKDDQLSADEAQLLEYLEIYVELKEKVGIVGHWAVGWAVG